MLVYKGLNCGRSYSACACVLAVLLRLSKWFICVRCMTYLELFKFPHTLLHNRPQTM